MSQRVKKNLVAFLVVVMLCGVATCPAYGDESKEITQEPVRSGEVSDWAELFGWLSGINGYLGYIYADTTNIYTALRLLSAV